MKISRHHFTFTLASVVAMLALPFSATAQEKFEGKVAVDLVSHYMWRGIDKGGISIMPEAKVGWQGLSLKLQGVTGFDNDDAKEINVTLGYKLGPVNIGVTDYWTSGKDLEGRDLYFEFDAAKNGHQLEGNIGVELPWFSLQAYTMFWGNDFQYDTMEKQQQRTGGKRAYSTYIELRVPFYFGGLDWDVMAGVSPFEGAYTVTPIADFNGYSIVKKESFYADKAACVKGAVRATKRLEFGDVKVPIFAELHANPYMKRANFLVGVSVQPFK